MASFPYNPTIILSSTVSSDLTYVFRPGSDPRKGQLVALNASTTLDNTNLPYSTISPNLPFLKDDGSAYTPVIDGLGNILVYAGDCKNGSRGSNLWQLENPKSSLGGNAAWEETSLSTNGLGEDQSLDGANYLSSGIAFSTTANSTAEIYVFGGMCPNSTSLTADNWTQFANYSNTMLNIQPEGSTLSASTSYILSKTSSRGPPVAEAGFTLTPLDPTFSSLSSNQSQSQNQNFVLLGGHTQTAFINMSQVALFSLPEQSWTFLSVDPPSDTPSTDLTVRDNLEVDSRSGHTALLTSDGKRIVMFGGWVGDTTQLAEPQLAVLELGQGYGGSGNWQWSIPSQTGPGLAGGTGIYGHGAIMLAGDVMMIIGGYEIPASTNSRRKRQNPAMSSNAYFFNTTSNSWIANYVHPTVDHQSRASKSANHDTSRVAKRAGLGAGLTLGILAIIIVVIFCFWYSRRLKKRRQAREEELRRLAAGAQRFQLSDASANTHQPGISEMSTVDRADNTYHWNGALPAVPGGRGEPEAERTGLLFEIPSPTRGLRRSLHSRGTYQQAPRYDNGRRTPDFSTIHPIDEREEYDEDPNKSTADSETIQRGDFELLSNVPVLNPFRDPNDRSRSPSPQSPQERELEIRRWVSDWTAADALMHHHQAGRLSPEKTDRTSSSLSDQSTQSMLSSSSVPQSAGTMSRTLSQRSAALFSVGPFRSTNDTTPFERQGSQSGHRNRGEHHRSRSLTLYPTEDRGSDTPNTFATARTSIPQAQGESEALLDDQSGETSPTKLQSRARGWMGSVRRVLTGERSSSTSPEHPGSASSSPIKAGYTDTGIPRRAASTGTMLWQKRQGAKDWDVEGGHSPGEARRAGEDEEWDVESAVEKRVVQVMFTVPREKLRVVNQSPDGDGESILSAEKGEDVAADGVPSHVEGKGKEKET